jgi:antirestriction protein ArdC
MSSIYETVTATIVEQMEHAQRWHQPWKATMCHPHNIISGKAYRGINTILLGMASGNSHWASYKQWSSVGAQVRQGEKATMGIFFTILDADTKKPVKPDEKRSAIIPIAKPFFVFNSNQVDNWTPPEAPIRHLDRRDCKIDAMISATGATIVHGGDRAFWSPLTDNITTPRWETFDSGTHYYATLFHELTHWSGAPARLNRVFVAGKTAYAAEELIAELGSAFAMAQLGLEPTPEPGHASYIKSWIAGLRHDPKAIFKAAALAQKAVDFIMPPHDNG